MHLKCKYYQQIVQSLIDLQNTDRISASKIKDWLDENEVAIYKVKNYYDEGLILRFLTEETKYASSCYFTIRIYIEIIENFYLLATLQNHFIALVKEFKDCKGDPEKIKSWLIKYYEDYYKRLGFLIEYSSTLGDRMEGTEYVISSTVYSFVIGVEVVPYLDFEEFMFNYQESLTEFDFWDKFYELLGVDIK